jgi:hypothetical protein
MADWTQRTEVQGYTPALMHIGGGQYRHIPEVRNNDQCVITDAEWAATIYERLQPHLPASWTTANGSRWEPSGLRERLSFLRYGPGHEFYRHHDGAHKASPTCISMLTVQVYMNDVADGGTTRFLDEVPDAGGLDFAFAFSSVILTIIFSH